MLEEQELNDRGAVRPTTWLIKNVIGEGTVNLIQGGTGDGKSSVAWREIISNYLEGRKVFGQPSTKIVPVHYICIDRTEEDVMDLIWRLNIDPKICKIDVPDANSIDIQYIQKCVREGAGHIIIDGIEHCPSANEATGFPTAASVRLWLRKLAQDAYRRGKKPYSVTGIMQSSKLREGQGVANMRQVGIGTIYWGATTHTIINVAKQKDDSIHVIVDTHRSKKIELDYAYNLKGNLELVESASQFSERGALAACLEEGLVYTEQSFRKALRSGKFAAEATLYRNFQEWLTGWKIKGWIIAVDSTHLMPSPDLWT
jgi:hypothetical protein